MQIQTLRKKARWALRHRRFASSVVLMLEEFLTHPAPWQLDDKVIDTVRVLVTDFPTKKRRTA